MKSLLLFIVLLSGSHILFGQGEPRQPLVPYAQLEKIRVKHVIENGFIEPHHTTPAWITEEEYAGDGRVLQRISINSRHWRAVDIFSYDEKKKIVTSDHRFYDFNTGKTKSTRSKNDTTIRKYKYKYAYDGMILKKLPEKKPSGDTARFVYDEHGRILQRFRENKCGWDSAHYYYNTSNQLVSRRHYDSHHGGPVELVAIDSFEYDNKGQLVKETMMTNIKQENGVVKHGYQTETIFSYNEKGLVAERLISDWYLSLGYPPSKKRYAYSYTYH